MKTNILLKISKVIVLMLLTSIVFAQTPKRVVSYSTLVQYHFSVPQQTDLSTVSEYDLTKFSSQDQFISTEISFARDNTPTVTTIYHNTPRYFNDYENEIYKSVTYRGETVLYDHQLNEISRDKVDPNLELEYRFSDDEVDKYGQFEPGFRSDPKLLAEYFFREGMNVRLFTSPTKLVAFNEEVEIVVDYDNYIYETRYFDHGEFVFSNTRYFQEIRGIIFPMQDLTITVDQLNEQIPMWKTELINYVEYSIVGRDGKKILFYQSEEEYDRPKGLQVQYYEPIEKRSLELSIYPNPAEKVTNLRFPFYWDQEIKIELINLIGSTIKIYDHVIANQYKLDVSDLKSGTYIVRCTHAGETVSGKLIIP